MPLEPQDQPKVTSAKLKRVPSPLISLKEVAELVVTFASDRWHEGDTTYPPQTRSSCKRSACLSLVTYSPIELAAIRSWIVLEVFKLNYRDNPSNVEHWHWDAWEFHQASGAKERFASVIWWRNNEVGGTAPGNNTTMITSSSTSNSTDNEMVRFVIPNDDEYTPVIYNVNVAPHAPGAGLRSLVGLLIDLFIHHVWNQPQYSTLKAVGIQTGEGHCFARTWLNGMTLEVKMDTLSVKPWLEPEKDITYNLIAKMLQILVPQLPYEPRVFTAELGLKRDHQTWAIMSLQTYKQTFPPRLVNGAPGGFDEFVDITNETSTLSWQTPQSLGVGNTTDGKIAEV